MKASELNTSEARITLPKEIGKKDLPRLLVLGDVPVEQTFHGSMLLYRLLENYPAGKLNVVETGKPSNKQNRLTTATYHEVPLANARWLNTRFHSWLTLWYYRAAERAKDAVPVDVSSSGFDAVLTVAHGFGWLAAASVARRANVPLHLIVHDDWPRVAHIPQRFRGWLDAQFKRVYCQAASRMCVSPGMGARFRKRYGKDAEVLFPSRSASAPNFEIPPARLAHEPKEFTVAFAGTINSPGYLRALVTLSKTLENFSGRLLIFGPLDEAAARKCGLNSPNVTLGGLLNPDELLLRLRSEADCLFVPMSFDSADRPNMELAFPSKLADYTAVGVPLMIYGPRYCSAVQWAYENSGVAQVIDEEDDAQLASAIKTLVTKPNLRSELARQALKVGREYFRAGKAQKQFENALLSCR